MGAVCCTEEEIDFNAEVELSHFHLLRSVGKGAFGKVRVVQHKHSKVLYALKYINKGKCIKMRAVENIIQERRLLEEIEYPLICNLRYAFQDDENMFMVLDLMLGGDLRFHLERQGQMKEDVVRFYVAEISLGLDYLHERKIIHRDLKPDNVLLDEKGHAHLTDFNIAVHFTEKKPLTSVAGSMAYMAPEVLMKKGYYSSVDWWSLGVVMYELLFSKRPFRGKTNSQLTHAILHEPLHFPENVSELVSEECLDCLKKFCERDITKRLGCGPNGIQNIKNHPWFKDTEWDKFDTKQAKAPFVPDSKRANFDATHELEELLLEDNPLKAKKRANPNQDLSELSKEMRMMEESFLIYDFTKMRRRSYFMGHTSGNSNSEKWSNKRQKSMSKSTKSDIVTAVERRASPSPSPSNMTFDIETADISLLPTPPPSAKLLLTSAVERGETEEQFVKKNKGEWLNERPVSPQNRERRRSTLTMGTFTANGRSSPSVGNDSDYFSMKPYPSTRDSPPTSTPVDTGKRVQAPVTQLPQPLRITSVAQLTQATFPSRSTSSVPITPPPQALPSSTRIVTRNMSSNGSLRRLSTLISPTDIVPPPLPPPTTPLPPPPSESPTPFPHDEETSPYSASSPSSFSRSSSSRVHTLSPPITNWRPPLPPEAPLPAKPLWAAVDFGEGANVASSGNSAGSNISSEHSANPSRTSGHFRSSSDVSSGSGALSAVGVPAGI